MEQLANWLKVLVVVVLLGNLVDFVLPKGDLKRYGGLVVGLVILVTVVSPLWTWMHDLGKNVALPSTTWTNTASGFQTVVQSEELHQAEAIVMNMPGVAQCVLSSTADGRVLAVVTADPSAPRDRIKHYVDAALKVTMGQSPPVVMTIHRAQAGS